MRTLTERRGTIHPISANKEALGDADRIKHCASLLHHFLLFRDRLHPFALANIRARPERYLVKLPPEVDHRNGETTLGISWQRLSG